MVCVDLEPFEYAGKLPAFDSPVPVFWETEQTLAGVSSESGVGTVLTPNAHGAIGTGSLFGTPVGFGRITSDRIASQTTGKPEVSLATVWLPASGFLLGLLFVSLAAYKLCRAAVRFWRDEGR